MKTSMGKGTKPLKKFVENKTASGRPQDQKKGSGSAVWSLFVSSTTTRLSRLNWRTFHIAIGTVNTAIAQLRLQDCAAALAIIKPLTRIHRHFICRLMPAIRTGDRRFFDDIAHWFTQRSNWGS